MYQAFAINDQGASIDVEWFDDNFNRHTDFSTSRAARRAALGQLGDGWRVTITKEDGEPIDQFDIEDGKPIPVNDGWD